MSLFIRVKDVSRLSIQENALIMVQEASPDDDDWWSVFYMYIQCILRKPHPLTQPYLQVLENIRTTDNESNSLCRFYATTTLGFLAQLRHDYSAAIRLYDEAEWLYETISSHERQRHVRAMTEDFVSLLTSTDTESVGSILDREIQHVRAQWAECQERLRQCQQEEIQTQQEQQKYQELADNIMSEDDDFDVAPPNDLLHLWQFPNQERPPLTATTTTTMSPPVILSSEIMEQVRKIPMHPKLAWLLQCVEDGPDYLYKGQVYRVKHHSRKHKKPKLLAVGETSSTSRVQPLLHTYATACLQAPYRPSRIYLEAQDAQDPQLVCLLALMGCIHISEHRRLRP